MFRNGHLDSKFNLSKFQIIMAFRILVASYEMPAMTANKMEAYCRQLTDVCRIPQNPRTILSALQILWRLRSLEILIAISLELGQLRSR